MKVEEAKKLTKEALSKRNKEIEAYLEHTYGRIRHAATAGTWNTTLHFGAMKITSPSETQLKAIKEILIKDGFTIQDHANPDPGDPRSRPYTEVIWGGWGE